MKLTDRLRELRLESKFSQNDIANVLNISASAYGFYEQGKSIPNATTLDTLANLYNVSMDYLMGKSNIRDSYGVLYNKINTVDEAIQFLIEDTTIFGFNGFDVNKLSDEEKINFANELLEQFKLVSYKYKK